MNKKKWLLASIIALIVLPALAAGAVSWHVRALGATYVQRRVDDLDPAPVAIVLGAKAKASGAPSDVLSDRIAQAVTLYRSGKVRKLLLSGDHGRPEYDEVNCMRRCALAEGVRPEDIFCDHAGFDTYDSMYRARDVFDVTRAIVVTQGFHLPRALYIARGLGIEASGAPCDQRRYIARLWNAAREALARVKAFKDVAITKARPRFLGPKIPIDGDGRASWDEGR